MLHENLQALRKAKGLSQEELAERIHVVRQTVSKWEKGLSVPDADLLIQLAEALDTSVSTLLGETVEPEETPEIQQLSEKLAAVNQELARQKERSRKRWRAAFFLLAAAALAVLFWGLEPLLYPALLGLGLSGRDVSVIGGADGPTAIFLSSVPSPELGALLAIPVLILAVVGICKTSKR